MAIRTFKIFYSDLSEECKRRYLHFLGVASASELNEDLAPLAVIDVEDDPETGNQE